MSQYSPSRFEKELDSLYQQFNMSLEEMSISYPSYKLAINKTIFPKDKQVFTSIQANLFEQQQLLIRSSEKNQQQLDKLNELITTINAENSTFMNRLNTFGSADLAAEGELKFQQVLYNELYIQNIILVLLVLLYAGIFIKKSTKSTKST